jgi:plastocyanin domain-containing protein
MKSWILLPLFFIFASTGLAKPTPTPAQNQVVVLTVTDHGFEPKTVNVRPGVPTVLKITRTSEMTCATEIVIPTMKIKQDLPLNKTVEVSIGKLKKGEIRFGCGMNMMESGQIHVE